MASYKNGVNDINSYQEIGWWDPQYNCMNCGKLKETETRDGKIQTLYDDTKYTRDVESGARFPYQIYSYCSQRCFKNDVKIVKGEYVTKSTNHVIFD